MESNKATERESTGTGNGTRVVPCSRNRMEMEADDLLCSLNARPPKALVGRAQWKIIQPPSLP